MNSIPQNFRIDGEKTKKFEIFSTSPILAVRSIDNLFYYSTVLITINGRTP